MKEWGEEGVGGRHEKEVKKTKQTEYKVQELRDQVKCDKVGALDRRQDLEVRFGYHNQPGQVDSCGIPGGNLKRSAWCPNSNNIHLVCGNRK
eukprot:14047237-Ditylum_brightwellii.AAC.1